MVEGVKGKGFAWPSQSPDLNPAENRLIVLKPAVQSPSHLTQLEQF